MEVKVLGPGCAKCKKLYETVEQTIKTLGIDVNLSKVESIDEIMKYRVIMTPALVIEGEVKSSGRLPQASEITSWLTTIVAKK